MHLAFIDGLPVGLSTMTAMPAAPQDSFAGSGKVALGRTSRGCSHAHVSDTEWEPAYPMNRAVLLSSLPSQDHGLLCHDTKRLVTLHHGSIAPDNIVAGKAINYTQHYPLRS
jgi:hypothetical protein